MNAIGRMAALGEAARVEGFVLAGILVLPADGAEAVRAAWQHVPTDVEVVILSPAAARALEGAVGAGRPLTVVMPP